MKFELLEVQEKDKNVIYNLMQIYTYELSFYEDENTDFVLLDTGLYKMSKYIDMYWQDDNRHPYILKCDGKLGGFALYRKDELNINEIAEFFVVNSYRKKGAGRFMADTIFKKYTGKWRVNTLIKNENAQKFWKKIISENTSGKYTKKLNDENTRYTFEFESWENYNI